jgi:hemerythrin-like domain-containing protein
MTPLAFDQLGANHDRLQRMLRLLQWLRLHLTTMGCDAQARDAAGELLPFFDQAAPAHHEDEERHVFPPLLAAGQHVQTVYRLQREHLEMAELWPLVRAALQPVAAGAWDGFAPDDEGLLERFARLYDWHIAAEDELVFPAAAQALDEASLAAIAEDMARRRGAR